jgi:hypothetical protein
MTMVTRRSKVMRNPLNVFLAVVLLSLAIATAIGLWRG